MHLNNLRLISYTLLQSTVWWYNKVPHSIRQLPFIVYVEGSMNPLNQRQYVQPPVWRLHTSLLIERERKSHNRLVVIPCHFYTHCFHSRFHSGLFKLSFSVLTVRLLSLSPVVAVTVPVSNRRGLPITKTSANK